MAFQVYFTHSELYKLSDFLCFNGVKWMKLLVLATMKRII